MGKILEKFGWTTVFLLCDTNDRITTFYGVACSEVRNFLRQKEGKFVVNEASFDSAVPGSLTSRIFDMISASARGSQNVINVKYICKCREENF